MMSQYFHSWRSYCHPAYTPLTKYEYGQWWKCKRDLGLTVPRSTKLFVLPGRIAAFQGPWILNKGKKIIPNTEFLTKCHLHFIIHFKAITPWHVESWDKDIFTRSSTEYIWQTKSEEWCTNSYWYASLIYKEKLDWRKMSPPSPKTMSILHTKFLLTFASSRLDSPQTERR